MAIKLTGKKETDKVGQQGTTDLKKLKGRIEKALEETPQKEGESGADWDKRLNKKYSSLNKEVKKLSLSQKLAMWDDMEPWAKAGTTLGYPGKPKIKPKTVSKMELLRRGPYDEEGNLLYRHGRGRGNPYYGLGMEDPLGFEDIKKGGRIKKRKNRTKKKNYSKGGGVRPTSY